MRLFRRAAQQPSEEPSPPPSVATFATGDLSCQRAGCDRLDGVPCAFTDRRQVSCRTSWCPDHRGMVGGRAYCSRHSGVVAALELGSAPVPDVDSRAASLATWVIHSMDVAVGRLLLGVAAPGSTEAVGEVPVHLVRPPEGGRRWEGGWQLYDHTGALVKVTIAVSEATDPEVQVRVGRGLVARGVPPWITHRLRGEVIDEHTDARERREYFGFFEEHIREAVQLEREVRLVYQPPA